MDIKVFGKLDMENHADERSVEQDESGSALPGHIKFELKSFIWRKIAPRKRIASKPLLQIGSGGNPQANFENIDFYENKFWKTRHIGHDLRYPLPFADNSFEGVYSEHTLEHLGPHIAQQLLAEIARVTKPGGIFRCSVPNLESYIQFYNGALPRPEFAKFSSGAEAIWNLTQNYAHMSVWDYSTISEKLINAGFSEVGRTTFNTGRDSRLLIDLPIREWESLYVEAVK